jgi:hypothetical protein
MCWGLGLTSLVVAAAEEDQAFKLSAAAPLPAAGGLLLDVAAVASPPAMFQIEGRMVPTAGGT